MEPAVLVDGCLGGFLILVIAEHHVGALGQYLAGHPCGVFARNLHLHVQGSPAAGRGYERGVVGIADDGCALRCPVAHGVAESDLVQECLDFLAERRAADDDFVEVAAESLRHLLANLLVHPLVDARHLQ